MFAKYNAGLQAEFATITKYWNQVTHETLLHRLIYGVQVQNNLTIKPAKTKVTNDKLGNFLGPVSYMATKVTEALIFTKGDKNQGHRGNGRRISLVEVCGKGYGGRRRGRVQGRD